MPDIYKHEYITTWNQANI